MVSEQKEDMFVPTAETGETQTAPAENADIAPEVSAEAGNLVKSKLGADLGLFYSTIKKHFSNPEDGWTAMKLEAQSPHKLAPIILELRNVLRQGGAAEPDHLINSLIAQAHELSGKGKFKHDFLEDVANPAKLIPGSGLEHFFRFATKGLSATKK